MRQGRTSQGLLSLVAFREEWFKSFFNSWILEMFKT